MKGLKDYINEAKKQADEEIINSTAIEIIDILNNLDKSYDSDAIRLVMEDVLGAFINADNEISNNASIAVGDAVNNIYNTYLK